MALLDSEILRIKYELGYPLMAIGAEPRIDHVAIFDQVVQPYLETGAATTSSTAVTAASTPTPVTLTLASGTGFASGAVVVIDVDSRQERVTAQNVSGASLTVLLSLAHTGTYPVTVEGGEAIVREILARLRDIGGQVTQSASTAGLKSVGRGAVEWYEGGSSSSFESLIATQASQRDELASAIGVPNLRNQRGGAYLSLY